MPSIVTPIKETLEQLARYEEALYLSHMVDAYFSVWLDKKLLRRRRHDAYIQLRGGR